MRGESGFPALGPVGGPDEYCASCPTFSSSVRCCKRASTRLSMAGSVRGERVRATGLLAGSGACARTVSNGLKLTKAKRNVATKRDLRSHWQEFQDMGGNPQRNMKLLTSKQARILNPTSCLGVRSPFIRTYLQKAVQPSAAVTAFSDRHRFAAHPWGGP